MTMRPIFAYLLLTLLGCSSEGLPTTSAADSSSMANDTAVLRPSDAFSPSAPPVPVCGDGVCASESDCDDDCFPDCWTSSCGLRQALCVLSPTCLELKTCIWSCPTVDCIDRCKSKADAEALSDFERYFSCGVSAGCDVVECGDGRCQPGESCDEDCQQPSSCYGRCDFTFDNGKPCQCDVKCAENNDCCDDYRELCDSSAVVCGDSVCDSPTETVATCTFDCGDATDQCLAGPCKNALSECYTTAGCPLLRSCLASCSGDLGCTSQCFSQATQSASDALQVLLSCGEQAGCLSQ